MVPGYELPHDQEDAVMVASLGQKKANPGFFSVHFERENKDGTFFMLMIPVHASSLLIS